MSTMIDGNAVTELERIAQEAQSAGPRTVQIGGAWYTTTPLHEIQPHKSPLANALLVSTLTGLRDYLLANHDGLDKEVTHIHVVNPREVRVSGNLTGHHRQRETVLVAKCDDRLFAAGGLTFGLYYPVEHMNIALAACFVAGYDREAVIATLGTVRADEIAVQKDDGFSQRVVVEGGAGPVNMVIPNPVTLAPFRTFAEIEQPESPFVLRVKKDERSGGVVAALFEADGGAWRNEAALRIRRWLDGELPGITILA